MTGYIGKYLRVDMTNERVWEEVFDEATTRACLGGTGIGAKVLYDEVPPGVAWNDPENRITIASGPLGGSPIPGSGSYSVVTKGPLTNGATATQANGFFGAYLRFCGYDGVIVQGAASRWLYLHVREGGAELRDASHLVGKDTWETDDLIRQELGRPRRGDISIAYIGPAGENLVKLAAVISDRGHAAGHNGTGAVMGSKRLKAIAVDRPRRRPSLKDVRRLREIGSRVTEKWKTDPAFSRYFYWGTLTSTTMMGPAGELPVKNYTTSIWDISQEDFQKYGHEYIRGNFEPKPDPCWACPSHHCHTMRVTEGRYKGEIIEEPEAEAFRAWGPITGHTEVATTMVLANDIDRWGMDTNDAGWLMGMVMECYEKGIINREDTDGLEMTWGNAEATREMLRKVAFREGFGNMLAEGTMRAARLIGGEAPNMAVHTMKGNTPQGNEHRVRWIGMFSTCLSSTGTGSGEAGGLANRALFGLPAQGNPFDPQDVVTSLATFQGAGQFIDSLGVCFFSNRDLPALYEAVQAATGWEDFTFEEAMQVGRRAVNRLRAFDLRHGIGPELDRPSPRYGSTPVDGPAKGVGIMPHWDKMVHDYYQQMGWDRETSKPLPETLRRLGLEQVAADIWG